MCLIYHWQRKTRPVTKAGEQLLHALKHLLALLQGVPVQNICQPLFIPVLDGLNRFPHVLQIVFQYLAATLLEGDEGAAFGGGPEIVDGRDNKVVIGIGSRSSSRSLMA
jgi:hypothetical protein